MIASCFLQVCCFFAFPLIITALNSPLISLGFDFGTSGVRVIGIDKSKHIIHEEAVKWSDNTIFQNRNMEESWIHGLYHLLNNVPVNQRTSLERICLSGTSSSALIYDTKKKNVSRKTRMYNYNIAQNGHSTEIIDKVTAAIKKYCPLNSPAAAYTSSLSKLLCWHFEEKITENERLSHQVSKPSTLYLLYLFINSLLFLTICIKYFLYRLIIYCTSCKETLKQLSPIHSLAIGTTVSN